MSRCTVSRGIWREDTILIFIWVLKTEKKEEILDEWWKNLQYWHQQESSHEVGQYEKAGIETVAS